MFSVPAWQFLFSNHDILLEHHRRYSKAQLLRLFSIFKGGRVSYWNMFLFLPIALVRLMEKGKSNTLRHTPVPQFVNSFLYGLLKFETWIIRRGGNLPIGISLVGHCRK